MINIFFKPWFKVVFFLVLLAGWFYFSDIQLEKRKVIERNQFINAACHGIVQRIGIHSRNEWLLVAKNSSDGKWQEYWLLDNRFPTANNIAIGDSLVKLQGSKEIHFFKGELNSRKSLVAVYHYTR
jgi:hypothetical protein